MPVSQDSHPTASEEVAASCGDADSCEKILETARSGDRISTADALALALHAEADSLFSTADSIRQKLHPDSVVTYVVDRNINYSNICTSVCSFCAFFRKPGDPEGYLLTIDEILEKVDETLELGGSGTLMQGGLHPDLPLSWYTDMLRSIKQRHAEFYLHCFSPTEIHGLCSVTGLDCETILVELKAAGLDSIPGGGGEILVDAIRKRRRSSCSTDEWLEVSATAHRLGIPTTATMMIGLGEQEWMRAMHLERVRSVQDQTGGFISFIPWTFQPDNTPCGGGKSRFYAVKYNSGEMGGQLFGSSVIGGSEGYVTLRSVELSGKGIPSQPMIYTGHQGSAQVVATGLVNSSTGELEKINLNPAKFAKNITILFWRKVK